MDQEKQREERFLFSKIEDYMAILFFSTGTGRHGVAEHGFHEETKNIPKADFA
jgi:hypothetical protein